MVNHIVTTSQDNALLACHYTVQAVRVAIF